MSEPSANTGSSISMILIVLAVCIITLELWRIDRFILKV